MDDMSENAKSEQYQEKTGKQPHWGGGSDSAALHLFSD